MVLFSRREMLRVSELVFFSFSFHVFFFFGVWNLKEQFFFFLSFFFLFLFFPCYFYFFFVCTFLFFFCGICLHVVCFFAFSFSLVQYRELWYNTTGTLSSFLGSSPPPLLLLFLVVLVPFCNVPHCTIKSILVILYLNTHLYQFTGWGLTWNRVLLPIQVVVLSNFPHYQIQRCVNVKSQNSKGLCMSHYWQDELWLPTSCY